VPDSVKTLKDFLAWAKANPAQASYGSPGAGSPPHELAHVPCRGTVPGIQDLLGGRRQAHRVHAGGLKAVALISSTDTSSTETPTI
jgi:tripartite-type tricarboxylate transporter receptor subunit TctC